MPDHRTTLTGLKRCPRCFFPHDAHTHCAGPAGTSMAPVDGDLTVCSRCLALNQFHDGKLVPFDEAQLDDEDRLNVERIRAAARVAFRGARGECHP